MPSRSQCLRKVSLLSAALLVSSTLALAGTLTGVVTNRTADKPSAGDTIAVINTAQSMDEIAKSPSDAHGRFHVDVPDGGQILLHITHNGADYFKSVPPGAASVDIDVYDSAAKVDGISGEAMVIRAETDVSGKTLNVVENLFVQNSSSPPRTQFGGNTFDVFLPKNAVVQESLASSPGGLPTNSKVVDAGSGHYAFTFPIRPGETRFQVSYSLPYNGKQPFSLKLSVPTGDVAVMLPKTMQFQGSPEFQPINPDVNAQSFDAHQPPFAEPIQFTIAGTGQLPESQGAAQGTAQGNGDQSGNGGQPSSATDGARPGGGLGAPIDPEGTNDTLAKYKWWILGALGLALAAGAGVMLKSQPAQAGQPYPAFAPAGAAPSPVAEVSAPASAGVNPPSLAGAPFAVAASGTSPLLHALKDELFELETDRLAGRLSESDYAQHKAAFDLVLRRALGRIQAAPAASND